MPPRRKREIAFSYHALMLLCGVFDAVGRIARFSFRNRHQIADFIWTGSARPKRSWLKINELAY